MCGTNTYSDSTPRGSLFEQFLVLCCIKLLPSKEGSKQNHLRTQEPHTIQELLQIQRTLQKPIDVQQGLTLQCLAP